jgi:hypothetical protein
MKGKLIKTDVNYILEDNKGVVIASTSLKKEGLSLSLKNCQAVELGYDLGELADEHAHKTCEDMYEQKSLTGAEWGWETASDFKKGFQKALELISDKKFSEEQLREAFFHVQNEPTFDVFKQSLQQTEWDIEIETVPALSNNGNVYYGDIPKLDENNCLILKKYKNG